jgi:two-component system chemotaxis sensor kinase CheA
MNPTRTGRLFTRLYGGFLVVALAGLVFAEVLVDRTVQRMAREQVEERLSYIAAMLGQMCASALFGPVDSTDASLSREVADLGRAVHTQLFLMTTDGDVVIDSDAPNAPNNSVGVGRPSGHGDEPEVAEARRAAVGVAIRGEGPERKIYVARPIERDGKLLGFARVAFPMNVVEESIVAVRLRFAIGAAAAVVIALVLGFLISLRIVRPVRALAQGARRIGAGHYDQHIAITTNDELADLARAFNEMARDLKTAMGNLARRNQDLRLVFDNVKQGFITADLAGVLSRERSAILDRWFGTPKDAARVWDYLGAHDANCRDWFRLSWEAMSEDVLPLELAIDQLPKILERGLETFDLAYIPIRADAGLSGIVVVVTDITGELERERAVRDQVESIAIFRSITLDRRGFAEFLVEGEALMQKAMREGASETELMSSLHTLKGVAAAMGIATVATLCHGIETDITERRSGQMPDRLHDLEQRWQWLLSTARQLGVTDRAAKIEVADADLVALLGAIQGGAAQEALVSTLESWRLEPTELRLARFANEAEAMAQRMGKQVDVHVDGHGVRLDSATWRNLWSAFTHAVRNAVDHGVEGPAERRARHKPERARLDLVTQLDENGLVIEIRDDGPGISWDKVRTRGKAAGLPFETHEDLLGCLCHVGVTTKDDVTETSGRGIGLAVLKRATEAMGGRMEIDSTEGSGTSLQLRFAPDAVNRLGPHRVSGSMRRGEPSARSPGRFGQQVA